LSRLLLLVQNSLLQGLLSIRSSTSEWLFIILVFLFEKRAMSLETTRPLSMPHRPHMPNHTRDTMLYHSIMYERQVCYHLPSARRIQPCWHSQQALGLCFGMANHECPSICSRRYMGSFRWWMHGGIASSWIHVICLDNTLLPRKVTRFAWWRQDLHAIKTGIHGFGYLSPLIRIAPFSAHKLIRQDTAVLHQAIIV
jgi:hypothetical protein